MRRKKLSELEADLMKLKEREAKIKEEMIQQRKLADAKAMKERNTKIFHLAEMIISLCGADVLDQRDEFEEFLRQHLEELQSILQRNICEDEEKGYRGEASCWGAEERLQ